MSGNGPSDRHRVVVGDGPRGAAVGADDGLGRHAAGPGRPGRIVPAVPDVIAAPVGLVTAMDVPLVPGRGLLG